MMLSTNTTVSRGCATSGARRTALAVVAALLVTGTAVGVRAETPADFDEDGVADAADACPDTDSADLVESDGCVIVSCELGIDGSGWSSHRAYLLYIADWTKAARAAGRVTSREARELLRRARKSTCGNPELVRCCVFADFEDDAGRCHIMSESACDARDDKLFESDGGADEEGAGSCLPNPCRF